MARQTADGMLGLSAMVSNLRLLSVLGLALLTGGCAGGDGVRAAGEGPPVAAPAPASPLAQVAEGSSTAADLDRIMAEHPGSANASELAEMRGEVANQERVQRPDVDAYEPHDRRRAKIRPDPADEVVLEGPVDKHDRFADDKAAQMRYQFSWRPTRVDLQAPAHQGQ
jgi:hypothetical protein